MVQRRFILVIILKMEMADISRIAIIFLNLQLMNLFHVNDWCIQNWEMMCFTSTDCALTMAPDLFFSQMKASVIGLLYKKLWNLMKSELVTVILSRMDKSWIENHRRKTIDKLEQLLIQKESEHWKNIPTRLINTVLYTAEHSMVFLVHWVICTHKITENIYTSFSCWQNSFL